MNRSLFQPILGTTVAIAITTSLDAAGLAVFSALPLFPLMAIFWFRERLSRTEVGFVRGRPRDYLAAVVYPILVIGAVTLVALAAAVVDTSATDWNRFWLNLVAGGLSTVLVTMITEEGFFRGWLWASLRLAGLGPTGTLLWSSLAFSLWHVSAVALPTGFDLPVAQIPVYLINVFVIGAIWGLLRLASGSVLVASVSHGLWNGLAYALFAFGTKVGALGVRQTAIYGPEVGIVGLVANLAFLAVLWWWVLARGRRDT